LIVVESEMHLTVNPSSSEYVGSNPTAPIVVSQFYQDHFLYQVPKKN